MHDGSTHVGGWGGRTRTFEWRIQSPLPYHLATPQRSELLPIYPQFAPDGVERRPGPLSAAVRIIHPMAGRVTWTHEWDDTLDLAEEWEAIAPDWISWARAPDFDSYWRYHRDLFLELLPAPPLAVLDMGCGEGRLPRDLKQRGYYVCGVDTSPTLIAAALDVDPAGDYRVAPAGDTGFPDASFDMVVAFKSLHDIDDLDPAIAEVARVLRPEGRFCMAIVHPLNSAGTFDSSAPDATYRLEGPYLEERKYVDESQGGEYHMRFAGTHRPLEAYFDALERHGLLTERVREVSDEDPSLTLQPGQRYRGVPLFLHLRAVKPSVA